MIGCRKFKKIIIIIISEFFIIFQYYCPVFNYEISTCLTSGVKTFSGTRRNYTSNLDSQRKYCTRRFVTPLNKCAYKYYRFHTGLLMAYVGLLVKVMLLYYDNYYCYKYKTKNNNLFFYCI